MLNLFVISLGVCMIVYAAVVYRDAQIKEQFAENMKWTAAQCRKANMKTSVLPSYDTLVAVCIPERNSNEQ